MVDGSSIFAKDFKSILECLDEFREVIDDLILVIESVIHFGLNIVDDMVEFVDGFLVEVLVELLLTLEFEVRVISQFLHAQDSFRLFLVHHFF